MKKTTLISIFIRIAIFIAVLIYLDIDFTRLKKSFSDGTNQTFLVIMALSLVLDLLKNRLPYTLKKSRKIKIFRIFK